MRVCFQKRQVDRQRERERGKLRSHKENGPIVLRNMHSKEAKRGLGIRDEF